MCFFTSFCEMPTNNYVESSFWNFDALFQPQQHPARDAHDTFFVARTLFLAQRPNSLPSPLPSWCSSTRHVCYRTSESHSFSNGLPRAGKEGAFSRRLRIARVCSGFLICKSATLEEPLFLISLISSAIIMKVRISTIFYSWQVCLY